MALIGLLAATWWYLVPLPAAVLAWLVYFFRDPRRTVPAEAGLVARRPMAASLRSVASIMMSSWEARPFGLESSCRFSTYILIGRRSGRECRPPAILARQVSERFEPGQCTVEREHVAGVGRGRSATPPDGCAADCRTVRPADCVCLAAGRDLAAGAKFGMIKLGSRTELILPAADELARGSRRRPEGLRRKHDHGSLWCEWHPMSRKEPSS